MRKNRGTSPRIRTERAKLHLVCTIGINAFRVLTIYLKPVLPRLAAEVEAFLGIDPELTWAAYLARLSRAITKSSPTSISSPASTRNRRPLWSKPTRKPFSDYVRPSIPACSLARRAYSPRPLPGPRENGASAVKGAEQPLALRISRSTISRRWICASPASSRPSMSKVRTSSSRSRSTSGRSAPGRFSPVSSRPTIPRRSRTG